MPLGGLITLLILLPNLLMLALPPTSVPPERGRQAGFPRVMEWIERAGQAGSFVIPFFYPLPALRGASVDALAVMALALLFYYMGWLRYALKGRRFVLLFAPLLRVPLPLAISPVIYFGAAALYLHSWPLAIATALLAAGHLYVSQAEYERCRYQAAPVARSRAFQD